jgi:hypothetical protein
MYRLLVLAAVAATLAACATQYAPEGFTGGFDVKDLGQDVYRVRFSGNGYTTKETAQTYWLYRSAELALEKGFTGFEILSDMQFVMRQPAHEDEPWQAPGHIARPERLPVSPNELANASASRSGERDAVAGEPGEHIRVAHATPIFIYTGGGSVAHPTIEGDVHFIRRPVESTPPKLFNAKALRLALEPIVKAEKCGVGNVCPHVHEYLLPKGKLR